MRAVARDKNAWNESSDAIHLSGFVVSPYALGDQPQEHQRRFVAGSAFFNYDEFGSLRPGVDAVSLFSRRYIGLAVHVTLCGFAFHFFSLGYGRLLGEYLQTNSDQQANAAKYVLIWPQALAVFIGLVSDTFPLRGYRRKSYMLLGWLLSIVIYIAIFILDQFGHSGDRLLAVTKTTAHSEYPIAFLVLSLVAGVGIQIAWISAVTVGIEYAQREHLHHRGCLMAALVALYYVGGVLAKFLIVLMVSQGSAAGHWVSTVSLGTTAIILAGVSLLAIPVVVFFYEEDLFHQSNQTPTGLKRQLSLFWKLCHQNVVYRVLFFTGLYMFLLGVYNQNVHDAVEVWHEVSPKDALVIEVSRMAGQVFGTLVWRIYLRNVSWRKLAFWGTVAYISLYVVANVTAAYSIVRDRYFYGILMTLAGMLKAWVVVYPVILATEIAEIGHEGVTVGLGLSFNGLSLLADYTLAAVFPKIFGFEVTMDQVGIDDSATRNDALAAFCITIAFNLLAFAAIRLPPQQKLDAQQMRSFGGYNRFAGSALLITFAVFVSFNLVANIVVVL